MNKPKRHGIRAIAVLLLLMMIVTVLPMPAFAANGYEGNYAMFKNRIIPR